MKHFYLIAVACKDSNLNLKSNSISFFLSANLWREEKHIEVLFSLTGRATLVPNRPRRRRAAWISMVCTRTHRKSPSKQTKQKETRVTVSLAVPRSSVCTVSAHLVQTLIKSCSGEPLRSPPAKPPRRCAVSAADVPHAIF